MERSECVRWWRDEEVKGELVREPWRELPIEAAESRRGWMSLSTLLARIRDPSCRARPRFA